ncbi:transposase zinc-binding domain-containing protein [Ferrovum myxofaciens]|uniref:transposase zinc-binding domain-containing protein n=1 Tax=Ferrovum myxofaciens TaxID=416213 RepID=UPI003B5BBD3D
MQLACDNCPELSYLPHSCGHRHVHIAKRTNPQRWINQQMQAHSKYFMVTFTLPA